MAAGVPPPRIAAILERDWWEPGAAVRAFRRDPRRIRGRFPAAIPEVRKGPRTTVAAVAPSQPAAACCHTRTKLPRLHPQDPQNGNTAPAPRCGRWSAWNCRALRRVLRSAAWGAGVERLQGSWKRERGSVGTWGRPAPSYALPLKSPSPNRTKISTRASGTGCLPAGGRSPATYADTAGKPSQLREMSRCTAYS